MKNNHNILRSSNPAPQKNLYIFRIFIFWWGKTKQKLWKIVRFSIFYSWKKAFYLSKNISWTKLDLFYRIYFFLSNLGFLSSFYLFIYVLWIYFVYFLGKVMVFKKYKNPMFIKKNLIGEKKGYVRIDFLIF